MTHNRPSSAYNSCVKRLFKLRVKPITSDGSLQTCPVRKVCAKIIDLAAAFDKLAKGGKIDDTQLANLVKRVGELNKMSEGLTGNPAIRLDVESFSHALQAAKEIQDIQKKEATSPANQPGASNKLNQLNQYLQQLNKTSQSTSSTLSSVAQIDFSNLISQIQGATTAMDRLASAAYEVPNMAACGGIQYHATGGRGTDTIPAMLSRGEIPSSMPKPAGNFTASLSQ